MLHPSGSYSVLLIPFLVGTPFGLAGGTVVRKLRRGGPAVTWAALSEMAAGGLWWALSAILPPGGFPETVIRSLAGAVLGGRC